MEIFAYFKKLYVNLEDDGGTPSHAHNRVRDQLNELEEDNSDAPAIVIYMVDPFAYGHEWADMPRLSILGLLRCYQVSYFRLLSRYCHD